MRFLLSLLLTTGLFMAQLPAQVHFCSEIPVKPVADNGGGNAVFLFTSKWNNGAVIKVKFTGGSEYVRGKVKTYAKQWEKYANITLSFSQTETPDILVSFVQGAGSWSQVGKNSRLVAQSGNPSMNFGWFDENTTENEFKRTTLHEFGHALGLLHEHKNPMGRIQWNTQVVYNHYFQQGWTKEQIDEQVINKYSVDLSNREYDPLSIMHYPVPAELTINGYSVGWNTDISPGDIRIIGQMYPKPVVTTETEATGEFNDVTIEHNVTQGEKKGMTLTLDFNIRKATNKECQAVAYFYNEDEEPLISSDGDFQTRSGRVCTYKNFTPTLEASNFSSVVLFIPYEEFELPEGQHKVSVKLSVWIAGGKELFQSGAFYFTYKKGIVVKEVEMLYKLDNDNEEIRVFPKFTIENGKGIECTACVFFYDENGNVLQDDNGDAVSFCKPFSPGYSNTTYNYGVYSDLTIRIPYNSLQLPVGTTTFSYLTGIYNGNKLIATSEAESVTFTQE